MSSLTAKLPHLEIFTKWDTHLDFENNGLILIKMPSHAGNQYLLYSHFESFELWFFLQNFAYHFQPHIGIHIDVYNRWAF